ncbi:hypothetical protein OESDEN_17467, partial [Oesophagostomum dentatum]
ASLEEHLGFVLAKANVLCLKLVDLDIADVEVITNVLHTSKAKVSHLQLVLDRPVSSEIVSVIDATGAETVDVVVMDADFFRDLPFCSRVFRKEWIEGRRKISLVYFRHAEEYDLFQLLRDVPHKGTVSPIVVTRPNGEELRISWDSSKFRCFTDEADDEGDDEFPEEL